MQRCELGLEGLHDLILTDQFVALDVVEDLRDAGSAWGGVGFISHGSVVLRYTSCGKPGCRCQGDPPQRHGPYYQWSRAVAGKTVSRRLSEGEAELYRSWITNRRHLEQVVAQMEQISAAAGELLLRQTVTPEPPQPAKH